jgi:hypothetical protein
MNSNKQGCKASLKPALQPRLQSRKALFSGGSEDAQSRYENLFLDFAHQEDGCYRIYRCHSYINQPLRLHGCQRLPGSIHQVIPGKVIPPGEGQRIGKILENELSTLKFSDFISK